MAEILLLKDSYTKTGTELKELEEALREMDSMTEFEPQSTLNITLLSLLKGTALEDGKVQFRQFSPEKGELPKISLPLEKGEYKKFLEPLNRELRENQLMLMVNNKPYYTSGSAISSMGLRAGISGNNLGIPSHNRNAYIAELFQVDENDVQMVVRKAGNIKKVFAVHSERYTRIPQVILTDIIGQIRHGLGIPVCHEWHINHDRSWAHVEFPEKAEDISKTYGLPDIIIPGLRIGTSDLAKSSVFAEGTWRFNAGVSVSNRYSHKHDGEIDSETILKGIDNSIFIHYTKVPEALCALMEIEVTDIPEVVESVFKQIGLYDKKLEIGKKRLTELQNAFCNQFNPGLQYTAYDIAKHMLALPKCISGAPGTMVKKLEQNAVRAVFADYKTDAEGTLALAV